jgi:hypothetical protein
MPQYCFTENDGVSSSMLAYSCSRLVNIADVGRRNGQMNPAEHPSWHIVGRKPGILGALFVCSFEIVDEGQPAVRMSQQRINRVQSNAAQEVLDGRIKVGRPCVHPATSYQNVERISV